jgi:hypothetical protein
MDEVPVLLSDLQQIRDSLHAAHMQSQTRDLQEQYQKLSNRQQWSALTKHLEQSLTKVEAFIKEAEDDDGTS